MFACHAAHVAHVHDAALVSDHAHCDGVLAHLGRHVLANLHAQILQHQQTCVHTRIHTQHMHTQHAHTQGSR